MKQAGSTKFCKATEWSGTSPADFASAAGHWEPFDYKSDSRMNIVLDELLSTCGEKTVYEKVHASMTELNNELLSTSSVTEHL